MPTPIPRTEAMAEAEATARTDVVELGCLELSHPSFTDGPIRLAWPRVDTAGTEQDTVTVFHENAFGYVYLIVPMTLVLPGQNENRVTPGKIKIDGIGREIERYLPAAKLTQTPVSVTVRAYLWPNTSSVAMGPFDLEMPKITTNAQDASAELTVPQVHLRDAMNLTYDLQTFPWLASSN